MWVIESLKYMCVPEPSLPGLICSKASLSLRSKALADAPLYGVFAGFRASCSVPGPLLSALKRILVTTAGTGIGIGGRSACCSDFWRFCLLEF